MAMARYHGLGVLINFSSESLLFYVSARRYHYPIDWTGVGLIVSWSGKREGDFTEGSLAGFLAKENTCNRKDCQLFCYRFREPQ
jgi:hypothetical protein